MVGTWTIVGRIRSGYHGWRTIMNWKGYHEFLLWLASAGQWLRLLNWQNYSTSNASIVKLPCEIVKWILEISCEMLLIPSQSYRVKHHIGSRSHEVGKASSISSWEYLLFHAFRYGFKCALSFSPPLLSAFPSQFFELAVALSTVLLTVSLTWSSNGPLGLELRPCIYDSVSLCFAILNHIMYQRYRKWPCNMLWWCCRRDDVTWGIIKEMGRV